MRIGGLASGMDTHQIIDDLMRAERMPLNKVQQRKQTVEWQRDAYREVNLKISSLRESLRAKGLALQSTFFQKKITSTNENAVSAVSVGTPSNVTNRLEVHQIATSATWVSDQAVQDNVKTTQARDWGGLTFDAEGKATLSFSVTEPGADTPRAATVVINESDKLSDVMSKINGSNLGVTAFFDSHSEQVILSNKKTGEGANIQVLDENTANLMNKLGFDVPTPTEETSSALSGKTDGTNAEFSINGFRTERTSNTFTINDMRYTLKEVTTGPVNISTTTDTDKIYDAIMKFVEDYNELVDTMNGKIREDRFRDFPPLTDEQKEAMSEREIEQWEEKAMSGLLRNDSILSNGLSQMRTQMFGSISGDKIGAFKQLSSIGLVSSREYFDGGKIILDPERRTVADGRRLNGEERLREAIENNPEDLFKLFMANGEGMGESGVIRRLTRTFDSTMEQINQRAGREGRQNHQFTLGREIITIDDRISNFERRLQQLEQRYWNQFTALETAMQKMNSQAEQMFSMLFGNQQ
ncbi:flagellar hook-associated protein 2 [Alkalihalobacterium sp. APHAB7]|uniref:flagellar hook-associated protein 2 n=1 Tax=Alkalihalobacterium sp. APHAB7 TaxID=3402081 RepID=UPI003AADBD3D